MAMYSIISMNMCLYVYIYDAYIYISTYLLYTFNMCWFINMCLYPHVMMGNHEMKPATFRSNHWGSWGIFVLGEVMDIYDDICAYPLGWSSIHY